VTGAAAWASFSSYNTSATQLGFLRMAMSILMGCVSLWGIWVILFESSTRLSKKTGADKHTSAFLFNNKTAASVQKKEWERQHKS